MPFRTDSEREASLEAIVDRIDGLFHRDNFGTIAWRLCEGQDDDGCKSKEEQELKERKAAEMFAKTALWKKRRQAVSQAHAESLATAAKSVDVDVDVDDDVDGDVDVDGGEEGEESVSEEEEEQSDSGAEV